MKSRSLRPLTWIVTASSPRACQVFLDQPVVGRRHRDADDEPRGSPIEKSGEVSLTPRSKSLPTSSGVGAAITRPLRGAFSSRTKSQRR